MENVLIVKSFRSLRASDASNKKKNFGHLFEEKKILMKIKNSPKAKTRGWVRSTNCPGQAGLCTLAPSSRWVRPKCGGTADTQRATIWVGVLGPDL